MQLLTPSGYKHINDCLVGEQLIAYDINDGSVIVNQLSAKEWFSPDRYEDQYDPETESIDEEGNVIVTPPVLTKTKEEVFEEIHGELKAYVINNTWTLYKHQSVWANLKVVHAQDLQVGDVIYDDDDNDITITSINEIQVDGWWRLSVSGDHSYIADNLTLHNATRYWSGNMSATSTNWNYTTGGTNWGSASGVADNATVPTSVDDVILDGAGVLGNSNSTISTNTNILSLDVQASYTSTIAHNGVLTIAGNITFGANSTITGTAWIDIDASITLTSNGKTWPNRLTIRNGNTVTLVGDLTVGGILNPNTGTCRINKTTNEKVIAAGGYTTLGNGNFSGSADVYLTGGTWTNLSTTVPNLYISGSVTVTGSVSYNGANFTYLSGSANTSGSTVTFSGTTTITNGSITWNNVTFSGGSTTKTIVGDLIINGLFQVTATNTLNKTTNEALYLYGGITVNNVDILGNVVCYAKGGTYIAVAAATGFRLPTFIIDGNITISPSAFNMWSTAITYLSGTVTFSSGAMVFRAGATITTGNYLWGNLQFDVNGTFTIIGDLNVTSLYSNGNTPINKTTNEVINVYGSLNSRFTMSGTADVYMKAGSIFGGGIVANNIYFDGNVVIGSIGLNGSIVRYLSGTVTASGVANFGDSNTITSGPIIWDIVSIGGTTKTFVDDFIVYGQLRGATTVTLTSSTGAKIYAYGGAFISGTYICDTDLYLRNGVFFGNQFGWLAGRNGVVYLDGPITLTSQWRLSGNITYLQGNINGITSTLRFVSGYGFTAVLKGRWDKIPIGLVESGNNILIMMDYPFTGTKQQPCTLSNTQGSVNIQFPDGFERVAKNLIVNSNVIVGRPLQTIMTDVRRFTSNRGTGIRVTNQSPNGFPKNSPPTIDTMSTPALGLANDPNFVRQ